MELSITNNAIKRFKANLLGNPDALGLRISIKPTGCNGYSYVLDYVSDISKAVSYTHLTLPTNSLV